MEITEVPFAKTIGLKKTHSGELGLCFDESLHNHLQTVVALSEALWRLAREIATDLAEP